jgi:hypothetical protein
VEFVINRENTQSLDKHIYLYDPKNNDAQMTPAGISGLQSSWVHSENESTGGLQQQRSERFYL